MDLPAVLRDLVREQDGLVTRAQAREAGLSSSAVDRRVASGSWHPVHPGVYRLAGHRPTPRSRTRAVLLALGPSATLTGAAAAYWWRLTDEPPAVVTVVVPRGVRRRVGPGVRVRRRDLPEHDRVLVDGVQVTKRARTVLEAAVELGSVDGARLLDRALLRGVVGLDEVRSVHHATLGQRGSRLAGRLIALAAGGARSEAERLTVRLLRRAGISGWIANHEVWLDGFGRVVLDLAWPGLRIAVEVDGWAVHRDLPAFLRDGPRQNEVVLDGWVVLRTSWYELRDHPERFLAALRRALAAASPAAA